MRTIDVHLGSFQDWLVVTAVGADEFEEDDEPDEDEDEDDDEPDDEVVVDGDAVVDVVAPREAVVELFASAGSWPETSWTAITPHTARNAPSVIAVTRRRMPRIRRRRPSSRARPSSRGVRVWVSFGVVMRSSFGARPWPHLRTG
jgi:hypothetical protein